MKNFIVPKLWIKHPNFFIIYFVTATVLHLGLGLSQLLEADRYTNPALSKVYDLLPIHFWALGSLFVFMFMTIGAYKNFAFFGRIGLGFGLFLCLTRGLLIELGSGSAAGLFVWGTISALHFTQISEPQVNPITAKE